MKVPYLSASRLQMAQNCPLQYHLHYESPTDDAVTLRWKDNHRESLQYARLGNNIHNALEEWRRPNPKTGRVRRPVLSKLIEEYEKASEKNSVDFAVYQDGLDMLDRWFADRGTAKVKVLHVEQRFGSHDSPYVMANGTPVFGFIDLTIEHPDGTIELVDYKTQRAPITQDEADTNIQAGIYLSVARELWPDRPLRFTFDLLRYGTVTTIWSDTRLANFTKWLRQQYDWIGGVEEPKATIGKGCNWCAYTEICPKAQDLIQNGSWDLVVGDDPTDENTDAMLTTLAKVKAAKGILDKKQKAIENHIKNDLFDWNSTEEQNSLDTDHWTVVWKEGTRSQYLPSEVQRLVPSAVFGQMASLSKSAVERVLPILPEDVAEEVRQSAITKPQRRLTIRPKANVDRQEKENAE